MSVSVSSTKICRRDLGVSRGARFRFGVAGGATARLDVALDAPELRPVAQRASTQTRSITTAASWGIR